ncbi:MAG: ectoine/hydroxyectoine ABC transporter permease subunit EhuC [Deinococcus sp.]|nr:ectoine/hydroxyectoine ABC transporter permease subunit EhuC [Deinococcus sp.]
MLPRPFDLVPWLLGGALLTIEVTLLTIPLCVLISVVVGLARLSRFAVVRFIATVYVEVIRGTSALVQLFIIFFVLPFLGVTLPPLVAAVLGLGLNFGAYMSEVVRAGILSVDVGQREAAIALNMPPGLTMRHIIFPQAWKVILPAFGNFFIELFKATSLVSLVAVPELVFSAKVAVDRTFRITETFALVALFYFLMTFPASRGVRLLERRLTGK